MSFSVCTGLDKMRYICPTVVNIRHFLHHCKMANTVWRKWKHSAITFSHTLILLTHTGMKLVTLLIHAEVSSETALYFAFMFISWNFEKLQSSFFKYSFGFYKKIAGIAKVFRFHNIKQVFFFYYDLKQISPLSNLQTTQTLWLSLSYSTPRRTADWGRPYYHVKGALREAWELAWCGGQTRT